MNPYLMLAFVAMLPVFVAVLFFLLDRHTAFRKISPVLKQIIYGIVFGGLAVIGTEWGVPAEGAQLNCRDAAVMISGLLFGAPAGLIAGVIGGVERWVAVLWGVGSFTRVACSLSTLFAGIYAAALRKFMFEDKKPGVLISLAVGVVMEVFHMTMVFITNMGTPEKAMTVVKICSIPMITANGCSVMLAALALSILGRERKKRVKGATRISQTIQRWMLVAVLVAFIATSFFLFALQSKIADTQADTLLSQALDETAKDIRDTSDANLLALAYRVKAEYGRNSLAEIAKRYDISEISVINQSGRIIDSSDRINLGFDMSSGEQSREFLCLLGDTEEYVQDYGPITRDPSIWRKYAGIKISFGFIQVGYDADRFRTDIAEDVRGITKNRHVGKTGYILILNEEDGIVSAPSWMTNEMLASMASDSSEKTENTTGTMMLNGEKVRCQYRLVEDYYVVSILPEAEAVQLRNIAVYVNTFLEILVFAILFGQIYRLIKHVVVDQLKVVNDSLAKITGGDLNETVNVRTNVEFASLSDDINSTVDTLKRYIAEASARIDAELEFAKNIQTSALPNVFPAFPKRKEFDIFASMDPAKEVGGDFYDFYMTDQNTLHFLIADVSGKGIPAAMFMMRAKTELKSLTEAQMPLGEVFTHGNDALCDGNDAGMFVTAWQGNIHLDDGVVHFVNAGHNPPLVRRGDGRFEYLRTRAGFVLAGMEGVRYKEQEIKLQPGDILYLYTDGVTEATNASGELYGEERLLSTINASETADMRTLCKTVRADIDNFVGEAPQFDDITMVAFHYLGKGLPPEEK